MKGRSLVVSSVSRCCEIAITPTDRMGPNEWNLRVVSGQPQHAVRLEPEHPTFVHSAVGVCEPQLYVSHSGLLSLACALELDDLRWASSRGPPRVRCRLHSDRGRNHAFRIEYP
jgi:hypothetical protein